MALPLPNQEAGGRYSASAYAGQVYFAHTGNTAITWSVGLTQTTAVGLIVSNPTGTNKNLEILQAEFTPASAVAGSVALVVGAYSGTAVTHTTAITVRSALGAASGVNSVAYADTGSTLPAAPVPARQLYCVISTATTVVCPPALLDLGGSLIVPPGCSVAILATAAVTGFASIAWKEVAIGQTA
jgi:hypothetical protein